MRAERERVASETRATANAEAAKIRAVAEKERRVIIAEATYIVNKIKGTSDAEAALIYATAYNKEPNFYYFYRSLSAYKEVFSTKDDLLVLSPVGDFFRFFYKSE
jgi:membrane protease subunit HflC